MRNFFAIREQTLTEETENIIKGFLNSVKIKDILQIFCNYPKYASLSDWWPQGGDNHLTIKTRSTGIRLLHLSHATGVRRTLFWIWHAVKYILYYTIHYTIIKVLFERFSCKLTRLYCFIYILLCPFNSLYLLFIHHIFPDFCTVTSWSMSSVNISIYNFTSCHTIANHIITVDNRSIM